MRRRNNSVMLLETERLIFRELTDDDAAFIFELVNEPSFVHNIGDKGVRNLADARNYILDGPVASYEECGYGLWLVELKETGESIGICGLVKRDSLPDPDIGFAFLPQFWSQGYAFESAAAVKNYSGDTLGINRLLAVTNPDNVGSIHLLEKIGFRYEGMIRLADDAPEIKLYGSGE